MFKTNDYWEEEFKEYKVKDLSSIDFDNCTFINCDFSNSTIYNCRFVECTFVNCDLSLSTLKSSIFNDVAFEKSKPLLESKYLRKGNSAAILFIDLNDFKLINDNYSHQVGDEALLFIANTLKKSL